MAKSMDFVQQHHTVCLHVVNTSYWHGLPTCTSQAPRFGKSGGHQFRSDTVKATQPYPNSKLKPKSPPQKFILKHLTTDNRHFTSLHCSKLGETKIGPNLRPQDQSPGASDWLRITWGLRGKELSYRRRGWVFTPACFHTWAAFHKDILSKFLKTFATLKRIQCFCQLQLNWEYLHCSNPQFWSRTATKLFPWNNWLREATLNKREQFFDKKNFICGGLRF